MTDEAQQVTAMAAKYCNDIGYICLALSILGAATCVYLSVRAMAWAYKFFTICHNCKNRINRRRR